MTLFLLRYVLLLDFSLWEWFYRSGISSLPVYVIIWEFDDCHT